MVIRQLKREANHTHPSSAEEPYHHCPIWFNGIHSYIVTLWPLFHKGTSISHHTASNSVILTINEMNFKGRDCSIIRGRVYCPPILPGGTEENYKESELEWSVSVVALPHIKSGALSLGINSWVRICLNTGNA